MNRDNNKESSIILAIIGIIPTIWIALLIAPSVSGGLPEIVSKLGDIFNQSFTINICKDSLRTVLVLLLAYGLGVGVYFSSMRNYRRREEHESAKWGNARTVNKKYKQLPIS